MGSPPVTSKSVTSEWTCRYSYSVATSRLEMHKRLVADKLSPSKTERAIRMAGLLAAAGEKQERFSVLVLCSHEVLVTHPRHVERQLSRRMRIQFPLDLLCSPSDLGFVCSGLQEVRDTGKVYWRKHFP